MPALDQTVSVTEANRRGISAIIHDAEAGRATVVENRGRPVAAVVGMGRLAEIEHLEADLRSAALVISRLATDSGRRMSLDDVITAFGFDRADLEAELDAELGHP